MSIPDAKDTMAGIVDSAGDQIGAGIEKAQGLVESQTGGKFDGQLDAGAEKVKAALDGLDGRDDDIE